MVNDPIIAEIRKIREEFSARFNHDLDAMAAYLMKEQHKHRRKLVNRRPRKIKKTLKKAA
jgi:hypothetical protein